MCDDPQETVELTGSQDPFFDKGFPKSIQTIDRKVTMNIETPTPVQIVVFGNRIRESCNPGG